MVYAYPFFLILSVMWSELADLWKHYFYINQISIVCFRRILLLRNFVQCAIIKTAQAAWNRDENMTPSGQVQFPVPSWEPTILDDVLPVFYHSSWQNQWGSRNAVFISVYHTLSSVINQREQSILCNGNPSLDLGAMDFVMFCVLFLVGVGSQPV